LEGWILPCEKSLHQEYSRNSNKIRFAARK